MKKNKEDIFLFLSIFLYILIFITLSLLRYHTYRTGLLDLGVYSQPIWSVTKGKFLHLSIIWQGCALASHMNLILLLLSPFYFIWNNPQNLLILQTIFLGISTVPIYYLTCDLTNKLLGLVLGISFLLYPWLHHINLFDFHPVALGIPFLLFLFYFLYKEQYKLVFLFALLSMSCQEDISLIIIMIGFYIFSTTKLKTRKKIGILIFLFGILWILISAQLISYFNSKANCMYKICEQGKNIYYTRYANLGGNFTEIIKNIIFHPFKIIKNLVTFYKIKNFILIFLPLGFLSFFNLKILILALPAFALNFLSTEMSTVTHHRTAAFLPLVFISAIFGIKYISEKFKIKSKWIIYYILIFVIVSNIFLSPIFGNIQNYKITPYHHKINEFIKLIPAKSSVSATNNLGSHLCHRDNIDIFPYRYKNMDYIFIDITQHNVKIFKELLEEYIVIKKDKNLYLLINKKLKKDF